MLILAGHATREKNKIYEFPAVLLIEDLNTRKVDFSYLRHSIDGKYFTQLLIYRNGILKKTYVIPSILFPSVFRYFSDILINLLLITFYFAKEGKKSVFIGVDPLNACSGIVGKKLFLLKKTVFYSVDYTKTRFSNIILNNFYLNLDKFAGINSDQTWNVSKRILDLRKEDGVDDEKSVLVPNAPSFFHKKQQVRQNEFPTLITLGIIDKQLDFDGLFDAIFMYKKKNGQIKLKIVGNGPQLESLKQKAADIGINKNVEFLGYLDHSEALKQIELSDIGLALYNGKWSFNYYGDSLKCREFFSYNLPVITTNTHSTALDVIDENAGVVVEVDRYEYVRAIEKIWNEYADFSKSANKLAKKYANTRLSLIDTLI